MEPHDGRGERPDVSTDAIERPAMSVDDDASGSEPIAHVIGRGRLVDFLTRLALPVLAIPPRALYRVVVHGRGFELPVEQSNPVVGFDVTYYVAARTADDAETRALQRARDRWETFYAEATGALVVAAAEVEPLPHRFARRSRTGFSFFSDADGTSAR